jgi:tRNA U34 5-carboxymethylaminomethyl modifying GTPase MnmE/TrmE
VCLLNLWGVFFIFSCHSRVENADVLLCVLSLSEIQSQLKQNSTWEDILPTELQSLATTDNAYFLLNKSDLVDSATIQCIPMDHKIKSWTVSLSTASGTQEFLNGLQDELRERSANLVVIS